MKLVVDGGNGMAGPMMRPLLEAPGDGHGRALLRARRQLPRPRAEPAAGGEPRADHRDGEEGEGRPRRSPGTATPTAASSSTARARSATATSSPRCSPSRCWRRRAAATILYDVRASRAVPDTVAAAGGTAELSRVGHAFFKVRMRETERDLRRRGLRPLLLPRLLLRGLGHDPGAADARAALREGRLDGRADGGLPLEVLHLRRDQLRGRRPGGEDEGDRGALLGRRDHQPRRRLGRLPGLALQRPPLQHRAAAAPQPRVAGLAASTWPRSATRCWR